MLLVINVPDDTFKILNRKKSLTIDELIILNGTPLPKGHGRLIDADAIDLSKYNRFCDAIDNAPTIIEADIESEDRNENEN